MQQYNKMCFIYKSCAVGNYNNVSSAQRQQCLITQMSVPKSRVRTTVSIS